MLIKCIIDFFYPSIKSNTALDYYVISFGMMSVVFLPLIMKIKYVESEKEKILHKKKYLHFLLLGFIFLVYILMKLVPPLLKEYMHIIKENQLILFLKELF